MSLSIETAISNFGKTAKSKLANPAATGQPEDQLRAPFEQLLKDIATLCNFNVGSVVAVGETSQEDLKTRPDYSVTVSKALVGFVELKAPGKGADPRRFKDLHDKAQWDRLSSLPNLIYSDGNSFSLWQDGKLATPILTLTATSRPRARNSRPHPAFFFCSKVFCAGSPSRRAAPANLRTPPPACVACSAMK